jgi:hypothetical protein
VPLQHSTIAEVVVARDAGVVDQDIQRLDLLGSCLNLRRVGHVQGQRPGARVGVGQGLARAGKDPLGASAQGFGDQGLPDAAVGPGHQDGLVGDGHGCCSGPVVLNWAGQGSGPRPAAVSK